MEIIKYPYVPEGGTHVPAELHEVTDKDFFILPRGGCYFANNLTITDAVTLTPLKRDIDYELGNFNQKASIEVGNGIYGSIFFKRPINKNLLLDISYIGGEHSLDVIGIGNLLDRISERGSKVLWDDIIKPEEGVSPSSHPHHANDLNGYQTLTSAILALTDVIANKTGAGANTITKEWVESRLDSRVLELFDGQLTPSNEDFDGRTTILTSLVGDSSVHINQSISNKKPIYLYKGSEHVTQLVFDPSIIVLNAESTSTLVTGVTKVTPLGKNTFLVEATAK